MLHTPLLSRQSYWLKIALCAAGVALADFLFFTHPAGATLGLFALAATVFMLLTRKGLHQDRRALGGIVAAVAFALIMIDRPGLLAWALFGLSLTIAALSARVRPDETAWAWAQRLALHRIFSLFGPMIDLLKLSRLKRHGGKLSAVALLGRLVMPVLGGAIFLALFATANPIISNAIDDFALPRVSSETVLRGLFWLVVAVGVLAFIRPRWRKPLLALPERKIGKPSAALTTSITWSLIVFNAVFALQNGLDIAFLWSGAPLPGDMGLAEYAHRGAYPLIVTALLAGLFVLIALQPGSDTAKRPLVRRLVVIWIAQNMLLVASSLLRTADYIEAYALTRFRIAAMIWMVLVGLGLLLICWRMLRDKSAHWLINANVSVVLVLLAVVSVVDLGAIAAGWNIRHAREVGGRGVELDLGYLHSLGGSALVSLVELETTTDNPGLRDRTAAVRQELLQAVQERQSGWRGWTWRDQRRLDHIEGLTRDNPLQPPTPGLRDWTGRLQPIQPRPRPYSVITEPDPLTSQAGN